VTSTKMRKCELKARKEWMKGRDIRGLPKPVGEEIEIFKMGFDLAWKMILTREKLYRTFNLHWEREEVVNGHKYYTLFNNDGEILAQVSSHPIDRLRFKYHLAASCQEINLFYLWKVDMNDVDRLKRRLKQEILEKYIAYKEGKYIGYKDVNIEPGEDWKD
jgi:hypothetical protein